MMDSSVLLPEPEAPTMASDSRGCRDNEMSSRMVNVPPASGTCLTTRSTVRMESVMRSLAGNGAATRRHCIATLALLPWAGVLAKQSARLLVVGDSLSAEYGLARGSGWVALLSARLKQTAPQAEVVNASISGDTTSGGLARLPALLSTHKPSHVVIELGANDALRGLPVQSTEANLQAMVRLCRQAGARVLLAGMQVPPNYGRRYAQEFSEVFRKVAVDTSSALVPFLLAGVADVEGGNRSMFQADGIHPVAAAHPRILENVWPVLKPWLG